VSQHWRFVGVFQRGEPLGQTFFSACSATLPPPGRSSIKPLSTLRHCQSMPDLERLLDLQLAFNAFLFLSSQLHLSPPHSFRSRLAPGISSSPVRLFQFGLTRLTGSFLPHFSPLSATWVAHSPAHPPGHGHLLSSRTTKRNLRGFHLPRCKFRQVRRREPLTVPTFRNAPSWNLVSSDGALPQLRALMPCCVTL
jgi:hypothetical protein